MTLASLLGALNVGFVSLWAAKQACGPPATSMVPQEQPKQFESENYFGKSRHQQYLYNPNHRHFVETFTVSWTTYQSWRRHRNNDRHQSQRRKRVTKRRIRYKNSPLYSNENRKLLYPPPQNSQLPLPSTNTQPNLRKSSFINWHTVSRLHQ